MTTKQITKTLHRIEEELTLIRRTLILSAPRKKTGVPIGEATAGMLRGKMNSDPVVWQRQQRREWNRRKVKLAK